MTENDACSCTQCEAKTDFTLIPADALEAVAKVFTQGAQKHGEYDWERYISTREHRAKLHRHINAFEQGNPLDESGHSHLAHAAADALIVLAIELRKNKTVSFREFNAQAQPYMPGAATKVIKGTWKPQLS